jgi:hypothetical protein
MRHFITIISIGLVGRRIHVLTLLSGSAALKSVTASSALMAGTACSFGKVYFTRIATNWMSMPYRFDSMSVIELASFLVIPQPFAQ